MLVKPPGKQPEFNATPIPLLKRPQTIMVFGDSSDGKTALVGELALYGYAVERKITRLYTADEGGTETIAPLIELGIIEPIYLAGRPRPYEYLNRIVHGDVPDPKRPDTWITGTRDNVFMYAFEGATSIGDALRVDSMGSRNQLGQALKAESDKDAHGRSYGLSQDRIALSIKESFSLPGIVMWTARARRGEDQDTGSSILGPQIVGRALTSEVPAWFRYTFRVECKPYDPITNTPEKHLLHLGDHIDSFGKTKGLGNNRSPLMGGDLPPFIEPASLVTAFRLIADAADKAKTATLALLDKLGVPAPKKVA